MWEETVFAARKKRAAERLGSAMLAAIGLMVRQYMGAPTEENEGQDSAAAVWDESGMIEDGEVNESFDPVRWRQLRGEASETVREQSEDRTETHDRSDSAREKDTQLKAERTESGRSGESTARKSARRDAETDGADGMPRAETVRRREVSVRETEERAFPTAGALSAEIERDARRYDGGFYLY